MDAADRRLYSWLGIASGPLFVVGGFVAAFTTPGAIMIWFGLSLLAAGMGLRTALPVWAVTAAALAIFGLSTAYTLTVYL